MKRSAIPLASGVTLDDADSGDRLRDSGSDATETLLGRTVCLEHSTAEAPNRSGEEWHDRAQDEEELPVVVEHDQRRSDHRAELHRSDERNVFDSDADRFEVRGETADQTADALAMKERDRL